MKKLTFLLPFLTCVALLLASRGVVAQFDTPNRSFHNATGFRLEGRHQAVACEACHVNGQFGGTPRNCFDCHWIRRKDDRYQTRLGTQCEQCHRPTAWSDVRFDHATQAGIGLNMNHRTLSCESCHKGANFRSASIQCIDCHQKNFAATTSPNHITAGFPTDCTACHRPSDNTWRGSGTGGAFSHTASFPLVGLHATAACSSCHRNGVYKGTANTCVGCHLANYNATKAPSHTAAGYSTACETCHRPTDPSWAGNGSFNHSTFPLVGIHATQACATCHKNGIYKGTGRDCASCHLAKYTATKAPNHAAAGFSTACESCHRASDTAWGGSGGFNHNATFALVGVHATQNCTTCHKNNVYKGTPRECVGCHQATYNNTRSPNHAAAGYGTNCESCHSASSAQWTGAFNHSSVFPLVGDHAAQACTACHKNNVYKGTPRDCVGCHLANYNATKNPNHASAGFSTQCDSCHKASDPSFAGATFNHSTVFALVGRHATLACASCHVNGVYKGTSRECVGCHQTNYNNTKSPSHAASGFPTTCESCHRATDTSWTQGTFNHSNYFPLTSQHNVTCSRCHQTSNYKVFTCLTCHSKSETDSKHRGRAGYLYDSNACYSCHPRGKG